MHKQETIVHVNFSISKAHGPYLSRAMFLVCPDPKQSTTNHLSVVLLPLRLTWTSITCVLIAAEELLNNLAIWNFLHFFSEKGFLIIANDGSIETEKSKEGCKFPFSHDDIDTWKVNNCLGEFEEPTKIKSNIFTKETY